jgi:hypothetical protein
MVETSLWVSSEAATKASTQLVVASPAWAAAVTCALAAVVATRLNTKGVVVSESMHHTDDDNQAVWQLMVVWVHDEFA